MKKLRHSSELLWVLGIVFVALGVSLCSKANLGVSMIAAPAFVVYDAIAPLWGGFSVGITEYVIQGLLLILLCLVIRSFNWRYLFTFAVAVVYGYVLDLFLFLVGGLVVDTVFLRWTMLVVGDVITALGVACFFRTYMPLQVYELFVSEIASHFHKPIVRVKSIFDISLLVLSVLLALTLYGDIGSFDWSTIGHASFHSIGLGTLVTALINSPLIALMGKVVDRFFDATPLFPSCKAFLSHRN